MKRKTFKPDTWYNKIRRRKNEKTSIFIVIVGEKEATRFYEAIKMRVESFVRNETSIEWTKRGFPLQMTQKIQTTTDNDLKLEPFTSSISFSGIFLSRSASAERGKERRGKLIRKRSFLIEIYASSSLYYRWRLLCCQ